MVIAVRWEVFICPTYSGTAGPRQWDAFVMGSRCDFVVD
jgi:hypothetical protein